MHHHNHGDVDGDAFHANIPPHHRRHLRHGGPHLDNVGALSQMPRSMEVDTAAEALVTSPLGVASALALWHVQPAAIAAATAAVAALGVGPAAPSPTDAPSSSSKSPTDAPHSPQQQAGPTPEYPSGVAETSKKDADGSVVADSIPPTVLAPVVVAGIPTTMQLVVPVVASPLAGSALAEPKQHATSAATAAGAPPPTSASPNDDTSASRVVPLAALYKYADRTDLILMYVGSAAAFINGAGMPAFSEILGGLLNSLLKNGGDIEHAVGVYAKVSLYVGAVVFALSVTQTVCWMVACERQTARIRRLYFASVMRQEVAFHDLAKPGALAAHLAGDVLVLRSGMSDKISTGIQNLGQFLFGIGFGFYRSWRLTLVMLLAMPFIFVCIGVMTVFLQKTTAAARAGYARAADVSDEALSNIRTVQIFGGELRELTRFREALAAAAGAGIKKEAVSMIGIGLTSFIMFSSFALAFWFSSFLIEHNWNNVGQVTAAFFAVLIGSFGVSLALPVFGAIAEARAAAVKVFEVIDRESKIDPGQLEEVPVVEAGASASCCFRAAEADRKAALARDATATINDTKEMIAVVPVGSCRASPGGTALVPPPRAPGTKRIPNFAGRIEFKNLTFRYPSRLDSRLFEGIDLVVPAGTTAAFTGTSGCGKSTFVALVQRLYDPIAGSVLVDGVDVRDLDLGWWRSQIGVVAQEPSLFSGTVFDNVRVGKPDATRAEVEEACRQAAIHDTIAALPEGYDTPVGAVGGQLSGGQKQRIAIARAIVRKPRLLILDEATSALDRKSEAEVQAALDALMHSSAADRRTVLVVAHRLVTIESADAIHYFSYDPATGSKLAETGTFAELMSRDGQFAAMASRQAQTQRDQASTAAAAAAAAAVAAGSVGKVATHVPSPSTIDATRPHEIHTHADDDFKSPTSGSTIVVPAGAVPAKRTLRQIVDDEIANSNSGMLRIARMTGDTWPYVVVGIIGSGMSGAVYPLYAVVLSKMLQVLGQSAPDKIRDDSSFWACMFVAIGGVALVGCLFQICHAVAGERLTEKLRVMAFKNMLRQDQTFYDMPSRDPGGLQGVLSGDCEAVHQLWGPSLGSKIQMGCTLGAGLIISFVYSWKLALLALTCVPLLVISGMAASMQTMYGGFNSKNEGNRDDIHTTIGETLSNIRTVIAFNAQRSRFAKFESVLVHSEARAVRLAVTAGVALGLNNFSLFGVFALTFWYGGKLIVSGEKTFFEVMIASMAMLFGAMGMGDAGGFASKLSGAQDAARRVFAIIDRTPSIDIDRSGDTEIPGEADGGVDVGFHHVKFCYPSREAPVLKAFTAQLPAGGQYGLIGGTGCGKSTLIQLLARYYNPAAGKVTVGGKDLMSLDVATWRAHVSAVFQEPALFSGTIAENIAYGRPDATRAEVEDAARLAGIDVDVREKMTALGYDTQVGYKGRALSGGQKQRVAIARGLLRRPRLLLLDEATSALDSATEAVVLAGIEEARRRHPMTIVSIAHRLTTIQTSDAIMLLEDGVLLEHGSHDELIALNGAYKRRWDLFHVESQDKQKRAK